MKHFPGIPGAALGTRIYVRESWLKEHPGEDPPDTEIEVAIVVMAMEMRRASVIAAPGQPVPEPVQKGWPAIELARIPYYAWRKKMDQLFNSQGERAPDEQGSSDPTGAGPSDAILS